MKNQKLIEHLQKLIDEEKMDDFFRVLYEFIKSQNDFFKPEYFKLEEQWEKNQTAMQYGMLSKDQSIISFSAQFKRFSRDIIDKIPDNNEVVDLLINGKSQLSRIEDRILKEESDEDVDNESEVEGGEVDKEIGVRPTIITVFCTVIALGIISTFINLIRYSGLVSLSGEIIFVSVIQAILNIVHVVGLWNMKKWCIPVYVINVIIGVFVLFISASALNLNWVVLMGIVFTFIHMTVLGRFYRRMT